MRFIVLLALLLAAPAFATEGGIADAASWSANGVTVKAFYLCDGSHASSENCGELRLDNITDANGGDLAAPDTIQFVIYRQTASCTPTVTVKGRAVDTTTAGSTQVDHTIQALLGTGTSSYALAVPSLFKVYFATVSADADCADLEVLLLLHYKQ